MRCAECGGWDGHARTCSMATGGPGESLVDIYGALFTEDEVKHLSAMRYEAQATTLLWEDMHAA